MSKMIHRRIVSSLLNIRIISSFIRRSSSNVEINRATWSYHGSDRPLLPKTDAFKRRNIFLLGPPGCGKTSVGRELARLMNKPLIDVDDHWLEPRWKCSVASKLAELGDAGFLEAEGQELLAMDLDNHIVSLTGSNPLHQSSMEHLSRNGIFVYLDVSRETILNRCEIMRVDRIVGQSTKTLADILAWREHIYEKSYDLRILIGQNETPVDIAKKIIRQLDQHAQLYRSTRDQKNHDHCQFLNVVQQGLAVDGGLYIANSFSPMSLKELQRLVGLSYPEIALRVLERFPLGTIHPSHLRSLLLQAYSTFPKNILPVHHLKKNQYLIETFHGPTASFKDLSLQLLPLLMQAATDLTLKDRNKRNQLGLLVATSGDTGCAALDAFARLPGTPVIVLYPNQGVSVIQQAQMQTAMGDVCVIGVDADFDYCQTMVKDLFNDEQFLSTIHRLIPNLHLSSANSINWARFLPQVVFSISSYVQLIEQNRIHLGDPVDICIPTGNFGNMLGAVYARRLGLPIRRLITASNENNIIADFIRTGSYDLRHRSFQKTISPSIDILISSNLERFLHLLSDGNASMIRQLFSTLNQQRYFQIDSNLLKKIQDEIQGDWANETQCLTTIRQVYNETQQLIDPHTAVAVHVADRYDHDDHVPMLISATAHYGKFPPTIFKALGLENDRSSSNDIGILLNELEKLKSISPMHKELLKLPLKTIRHTTTVPAKKSAIVKEINGFLQTFARQS